MWDHGGPKEADGRPLGWTGHNNELAMRALVGAWEHGCVGEQSFATMGARKPFTSFLYLLNTSKVDYHGSPLADWAV
jgi:hypothetical protein